MFLFLTFFAKSNKVTRRDYVNWGTLSKLPPNTEYSPTDVEFYCEDISRKFLNSAENNLAAAAADTIIDEYRRYFTLISPWTNIKCWSLTRREGPGPYCRRTRCTAGFSSPRRWRSRWGWYFLDIFLINKKFVRSRSRLQMDRLRPCIHKPCYRYWENSQKKPWIRIWITFQK